MNTFALFGCLRSRQTATVFADSDRMQKNSEISLIFCSAIPSLSLFLWDWVYGQRASINSSPLSATANASEEDEINTLALCMHVFECYSPPTFLLIPIYCYYLCSIAKYSYSSISSAHKCLFVLQHLTEINMNCVRRSRVRAPSMVLVSLQSQTVVDAIISKLQSMLSPSPGAAAAATASIRAIYYKSSVNQRNSMLSA